MRQLGDIAFLLHHYEFAASTYRLAAQDYLGANNVRWYAGVEVRLSVRVWGIAHTLKPQCMVAHGACMDVYCSLRAISSSFTSMCA